MACTPPGTIPEWRMKMGMSSNPITVSSRPLIRHCEYGAVVTSPHEPPTNTLSPISVAGNVYSVPSRLIGTCVLIRVHSEILEGYVGTTKVFELPRLIGKHHHQIDYHHIIWSLR